MRGYVRHLVQFVGVLATISHGFVSSNGLNSTTTGDDSRVGLLTETPDVSIRTSTSTSTSTSTFDIATTSSRVANDVTQSLDKKCARSDQRYLSTTYLTCQAAQESIRDETLLGLASEDAELRTTPMSGPNADSVTETDDGARVKTEAPAPLDSGAVASIVTSQVDVEADSALDDAHFLSFEEWKKQNSAKADHQMEQGDAQAALERQRPGINNALDALGDEGEIDIDFSGFGSAASGPRQQQAAYKATDATAIDGNDPASYTPRSKDAGKTCKERTNYASFDCAATVLKNNPECKSAGSVLVENKDIYMLNICAATNKFFIVELCNDILVDTVVLANYEFFSSIFRHFRVSVSDRYPVKMDKWRELGTFEARNTREVQAFLIQHPQIWARYLRVEFLTHYGSEYYCPVSLLRVHGTTMLEEIRPQEEISQGDDPEEELASEAVITTGPRVLQEPLASTDESDKSTVQATTIASSPEVDHFAESSPAILPTSEQSAQISVVEPSMRWSGSGSSAAATSAPVEVVQTAVSLFKSALGSSNADGPYEDGTANESAIGQGIASTSGPSASTITAIENNSATSDGNQAGTATPISAMLPTSESGLASSVLNSTFVANESSASDNASSSSGHSSNTTNHIFGSVTSNGTSLGIPSSTTNSTRTVATSSSVPLPQPSTQESFFKSISKRLQQLESNSTLSLQYIEEQSRILRDAFTKVEKRQISTTTTFLTNLNLTVTTELYSFRQAYEQLWQSTLLELESQQDQYQREMLAMSTRLTLVADELVWQKRMGIVQSMLLLLCLGLVLFVRSGTANALEVPLMQQMLNKSSSALNRAQEGWESPPTPESRLRTPAGSLRRRLWRSVTEPDQELLTDEADSRPETREGPLSADMNVKVVPPSPDSEIGGRRSMSQIEDDAGSVFDDADTDVSGSLRETHSDPTTPRMAPAAFVDGLAIDGVG